MSTDHRSALEVVRIKVERLADEAFGPFGDVLAIHQRPPDFTGISSVGWRSSFNSDSQAEVMFYRSDYTGFGFQTLERHHHVTQAFIPVGPVPAVIAVAAPTAPNRYPEPGDVRAFVLDGTAGYLLKKGVWHSPDRYPLYPPCSDIVIVTDRVTQSELEANPDGPWQRTEAIDYAEHRGVRFAFDL